MWINYKNVLEIINGNNSCFSAICDCRSAGRFTGKDPEPRDGISSGHMPFSLNTPFGDYINQTSGMFKEKDEIIKYLEEKGVWPIKNDKLVAFTCGSSVTAAVGMFALEHIVGVPPKQLRVYQGSWTEYATQKSSKIINNI